MGLVSGKRKGVCRRSAVEVEVLLISPSKGPFPAAVIAKLLLVVGQVEMIR